MTHSSRIRGGIYGLLVGDALGVPYEFHEPENLPPSQKIEFDPPWGFGRAHASVKPGTWSDDGAQALCLLASLLERGRFDAEDFAGRIARWYDEGYMAVDGHVFDVGITTGLAIRAIKAGVPASKSGPNGQRDNGNGSLMRSLPLAIWHRGSDEELMADAHAQSRVTHGHERSQICCALYCLWARGVLRGHDTRSAWSAAVAVGRQVYADSAAFPRFTEELESHIRPDDAPEGDGSGYVVDSLRSARWAVEQGGYEEAVRAAISLGHDTDTTACIAGGIAGLLDGVEAIPRRWLDNLRGRDLVEPLLASLCCSRA
jgi:ADP-ribosylglycohydrolase